MTVKKKTPVKKKAKRTTPIKIKPLIVITTQDKQTFIYSSEQGFLTESDFKLYDALLGKHISIQFGKETK